MAWRSVFLLAAWGLLGGACAGDDGRSPLEQDEASPHAQRLDRDGDHPDRDGGRAENDDDAGLFEPLKVEIVGFTGSGCTTGVKKGTDALGRPQLTLEDYGVMQPNGGGAPKSAECTLRLSVTGAAAFRTAELGLTTIGNVTLDSSKAEADFVATATWSGRGDPKASTPRTLPGRQIVQWSDDARWLFEQPDAKCTSRTARPAVAQVAIATKLTLSSSSQARAMGEVTNLSVEARAPKSARLPVCPGR